MPTTLRPFHVTLCLVIGLTLALSKQVAAQAPAPIDANSTAELLKQIGKSVTVKGVVSEVISTNNGAFTILKFSKIAGAFFAGTTKKDFDAVFKTIGDPKTLVKKEVLITGVIVQNQPTGEPMIMLQKAQDISIAAAPAIEKPVPLMADQVAEIKKKIGQSTTIRGIVKRIGDTSDRSAKMIMFSKTDLFGFALVVYAKDQEKVFAAFGGLPESLMDKTIDVTGQLLLNRSNDAPLMVINRPDQIKIVEEAPKLPGEKAPAGANMAGVRVGLIRVRFEKNVKHQPVSKISQFLRNQPDPANEYDPTKESYTAYIPKSYRPGMPHSVLVWLGTPQPPQPWTAIMEKHHVIWISPNNGGTASGFDKRISLALDAILNIGSKYTIDPERVYIGGGGSGAVVATAVAIAFSDIFQGGTFMLGVGYYRDLPVPNQANTVWRADFKAPPSSAYSRAKKQSRLVIVAGSTATSLLRVKTVYARGYKAERYRGLTYIEVPGLGNTLPSPKTFEQVVRTLDAPISRTAAALYRKGQTSERGKRIGAAFDAYAMAAMRSGGNDKLASQAMGKAKDLYAQLQSLMGEREKSVVEMIDQKRIPHAILAIKRMSKEFGRHADTYVAKLDQQVADARKPGGATRPKPVRPRPVRPTPGKTEPDPGKAAAQREASADKALVAARQLLEKDLVNGYLAIKEVSTRYRGTKAAVEANEQAQDVYLQKRRIIKPALDEADAQRQLKLIQTYIKLGKLEDAKAALRKLIKDYPRTKAASSANKLLEDVRVLIAEKKKKEAESK